MAVAILGLVGSFLGPAIQVGQCIVEPIKRQFSYLCCFNSNVQNLRNEGKKLENVKVELQMQVTTAENNAHEIVPQVKDWLKDVGEIQEKMSEIEMKIGNIQSGGCLTVKSRFSLSKIARKTTEAMKQLQLDRHNLNDISQPPPPASMASIPLGTTYEFQSRKRIVDDIMISLRDENVNMLGICGMGGVGKTTMAKQIMERGKKEHLFDDIGMVVVGQKIDKLRIQGEVAGLLGLELTEQTLSSRATKLQARIMKRRTLLVVDDVWEYLDLEELIGIPPQSGLKGCTVLLTSRDRDVLDEMGAHKVCEIETLNEVEAWSLFKEKVGDRVDDQNLLPIARMIVEECKGLPIALVNVAMALRVKKNKSSWEDALKQLKSSNPIDMPKILEHVYNPIKLSYNFLESQHPKSIFLLCCLFPEDYNISLDYLTSFAMGLRMFEDIRNLGEARNRICSLVEMLRSRFLLLEGEDKCHVRMHDVVRDVAIFIATEERRIKSSDCTWISPYVVDNIFELLVGSSFPKLHLLLVNADYEDEKCGIIDSFLEGKMEINVLSMKAYSLRSLPHTTQFLKNLKTLILESCPYLKSVSCFGELVNLEILTIRHCYCIEELPSEIMRLKCLRLLEILGCGDLREIAAGVISSLDKLEELKIVESFKKWEAEDEEKKINARLSELELLSNLTCLEIEVEDYTSAAQHIRLPPNIVKYDITIGNVDSTEIYDQCQGYDKKLKLSLPREMTLGNWIHECAKNVEFLYLDGDGTNSLELRQAHQNIRWLCLENCSKTTSIVGSTSHLEVMVLQNLEKLEEIFDGQISENLKELQLHNLPALKHLWKRDPYQDTRDFCLQLKSLDIRKCRMMEEVFLWNGEENERRHIKITFPKLKGIVLYKLLNLTNFCKGIEGIEFSSLTGMCIWKCPNLVVLTSPGIHNHHHSLPLFSNPKVVFGKLKILRVGSCNKIKSIFSSSIARDLVCLKELTIGECNEMVKIIEGEEECSTRLFPHLEMLILCNVPKLKIFCEWRCALELPSLEMISIDGCFEMERFSLGSLTIPNLIALDIDNESIDIIEDIDMNHVLHQCFLRIKEQSTSSAGQEDQKERGKTDDREEEELTSRGEKDGQDEELISSDTSSDDEFTSSFEDHEERGRTDGEEEESTSSGEKDGQDEEFSSSDSSSDDELFTVLEELTSSEEEDE